MLKKKLFLTVIVSVLLLGSEYTFAQNQAEKPVDNATENNNNLIQANSSGNSLLQVFRKVSLEGSVYFNAEWAAGDITLNNGFVRKNEKIRYNSNNNEVEVLLGKDSVLAVNENILQFSLINVKKDNRTQIFRRNFPAYDGNTLKTFFEVLYDGKTKILVSHKKVVQLDHTPGNYRTGEKTDHLVSKKKYYMLNETGKMLDIDNNKKSFLAKFENQKAEIESFVKKNKLSYKEDYDLQQIMAFIEAK